MTAQTKISKQLYPQQLPIYYKNKIEAIFTPQLFPGEYHTGIAFLIPAIKVNSAI